MNNESVESPDAKPLVGLVDNIGNVDVLEDKLHGTLQVIDRALDALSPVVGTAREFSDDSRKVCKLGLDLLKLALNGADTLGVTHGGSDLDVLKGDAR